MKPAAVVREVAGYLDDAAEYWLGQSIPPAARVLEESGFSIDASCRYCPRCGNSVGIGEATAGGCGSCRNQPAIADRVIRLGSYTGDLREWILAIKYRTRWHEMAFELGMRLGNAVLASAELRPGHSVLIPMPMPWQRRLYRGIDHARSIARGMSRVMNSPMLSVLSKTNGTPQTSLSPTDRRRSGSKGLSIRSHLGGWQLENVDVLIVDDVLTTGASIRSAARLIRRLKPGKVFAAVLAVSDDAARLARAMSAPDSERICL